MRTIVVALGGLLVACASGSEVEPPSGAADTGAPDVVMQDAGSTSDAQKDSPNEATSDAPIACEAGLVMCGNQCTDTATDWQNCGSCGHDCLAGSCVAGVCQAGALALAGSSDILAIDGTDVYWAAYNPSEILKCAKGGCNLLPTSLWKDGNWGVINTNIAFDANDVYWFETAWVGQVSTNRLVKCAKSGCNNLPTVVYEETASTAGPFFLATDGTDAYWTNDHEGTVKKCALGGCNNSATTIASGLTSPRSIAVDGTNVYWATQDNAGAVMKCAKAGCNNAPATLASSQNWTMSLLVDNANVYWANYTGGELMKCSLGGCSGNPTALASSQQPWGSAIDTSDVYWTDLIGGKILKCGINGCNGTPVTVLDKQKVPGAMAADAKGIYWSTQGAVMVLAK
jgi:hypothetical protein